MVCSFLSLQSRASSVNPLITTDQVRATIRDGYLDRIIVSLGKAKETVKVGVIQMLMNLAIKDGSQS